MAKITYTKADEYIQSLPEKTKKVLLELRSILQESIPGGKEVISYNIPAIEVNGVMLMYYSGYKAHVSLSFYPTEETYKKFEKELGDYTYSKSAIQFPLKNPLPKELIRDIVKHGVQIKMEFMEKRKKKK